MEGDVSQDAAELEREIERLRGQIEDLQAGRDRGDDDAPGNGNRMSWSPEEAPIAMLEWDSKFIVSSWNAASERTFGYTADEAIGADIRSLVVMLELTDLVSDVWSNVGATGVEARNNFQTRTKSGDVKLCDWIVTPRRDDGDRSDGTRAWALDVSGAKNVQEALQDSENRLNDYVAASGNRFWETDKRHRFSYVSPVPPDSSFPNQEYVLGRTRWGLAGADLQQEIWQRHLEDLEAHRAFRDFTYSTTDGGPATRHLRIHGSPIFDDSGDFRGYRGIAIDETNEVQTQSVVEDKESRFLDAVESISEGLALWGADERFIHCNGHFRDRHLRAADLLQRGATYESFVRRLAEDDPRIVTDADREVWITKGLDRYRNPVGGDHIEFRAQKWTQIRYQQLADGSTIVINADISESKRLEEAIRISESKYRSLFEEASDSILLLDIDSGGVVDANMRAADKLGYSREELLSLTIFQLNHEASLEDFRRRIRQIRDSVTATFEATHHTKGGTTVPVEISAHLLEIGGQTLAQIQVRDITERKLAEEALRVSEQRFRDFADSAADRFWESDENFRITYVSGSDPREGAGNPEDLVGKTRWEWANGDVNDPLWRDHISDLKARRPFRNFRYIDSVTGVMTQHLRVNGRPIFDENGVFKGYRGTTVNETAEVEVQEEATKIQQRFLAAIESTPEGVVLWDADMQFVMCNGAFRDINPDFAEFLTPGVHLQAALKNFVESDQSEADDPDAWVQAQLAWYQTADEEQEEFRNGKWFRMRRQRLIDGSTIIFQLDITDTKRREEALGQSQKMEAIGQLTGGIAHDFNNLLAAILGNLELLEANLANDQPNALRVKRAINSVRRGAQLTSRLLAFSRKQTLEPTQTHVGELVTGMMDMLERSLGATINMHVHSANRLWQTNVDQSQLENAVLNLAINARDAMPKGGDLFFECENAIIDSEFAVEHPYARVGEYVALTVRDTGIGIPSDVMERVFEPFFTTKGVGEGSGLGLSMVFGFVKQSEGFIEISSEVGQGTTITIYLPNSMVEVTEPKVEESEFARYYGAGERILVIEDDQDVLEITVTMLEDLGYEVLSAGDGDEAFQLLDSEAQIAAVVSDVVLPGGTSGVEIATKVKETSPDVGVLLISGHIENSKDSADFVSGEFELLNKPFRMQDLARLVRNIVTTPPLAVPPNGDNP